MHEQMKPCAGSIHVPVPPTPPPSGPGGLKDVVALLVPFLLPTPQDIANNLLYYYVQYHLQLGFTKFVQYTQVRHLPRPTYTAVVLGMRRSSAALQTDLVSKAEHGCHSAQLRYNFLLV